MDYLKMFLATTASLTTASALLLYKYQQKLIYPNHLVADGAGVPHDTPDLYDLEYEDLIIETIDHIKIHGFLCLQPKSRLNLQNETVLILNPNAGNIGLALPTVKNFHNSGYNVLIYDYRGYGTSTGEPSEIGLKIDADTILKFIENHEILKDSEVTLYGRSLGGAVAIYLASKNHPLINKVILENTFLSIRKTIPHVFPFLKHVSWLCHQLWDSETLITKVQSNVKFLFLSAELDEIVPPSHMKKLYELVEEYDYKKFILFEGAHHNDTPLYPGYWDIVSDFLDL
ncbi:Abhydrolase domain-containing protein 13 [Wickerhamomyces ciferrii]|uniref:Abhydrolase domain-containing protein 13 n=1 Tax=Wickerhamomyces ciferrii (strain ATCC 14091 / BCRC 22168 / CBS 111 / JCM 3599 / NBRC 0793 / NRRL Y-1031 F-60-10) TaxID=1206466 RepID=K0KEA3_WICCF|nr:Abhydrolase domain-containing protein 13 [Wickerhamomyces ciferrii]CCH43450.1 Abhydrolase domain-containing protein 13 [Wickerhamomyces ciferrii]